MNEHDDKTFSSKRGNTDDDESKQSGSRQQKQSNRKPRGSIRKQDAIIDTLASDQPDSTTTAITEHLHDNQLNNVNNKLKYIPTELDSMHSSSTMNVNHPMVNSIYSQQATTQSISKPKPSPSLPLSSTANPIINVNPVNFSEIGNTQTKLPMSSLLPDICDDSQQKQKQRRKQKQKQEQQLSMNTSTFGNTTTTTTTTQTLPKIYEHSASEREPTSTTSTTTKEITTESTATKLSTKTGPNRQSLCGTNHIIPNVFFTKPQSSEEQEDYVIRNEEVDVLKETLKGFDQNSALRLKQPRKSGRSSPSNQYNQQTQLDQVQMLSRNPIVHEPACRSASSSPRIARSNHIKPIHENGNSLAYGLHVPANAAGRKLSLQPIIHQQQQLQYQQQNYHQQHQQQHRARDFLDINNSSSYLGANNGISASSSNLSGNNLTIVSQHLAPRKSVIGRLERSSFQAQRLSDVGVAFGQQITAKMGLKLPASQERIVEQTRWLYLRYVFVKLRLNSLPLRDLNITKSSRARRAAAFGVTIAKVASNSAPVTASVVTPDITTSSTDFKFNRKRTALSQNINSQDLNLLAARMNNVKSDKNEIESNNNNDTLGTNSIGLVSANIDTATSGRKYIMDPTINNQIFTVILTIVKELKDRKPEFYGDTIYELIGIDKFSSVQDLLDVQMTICQEMTRSEISWCRIIALFSLFGAISLDCVRLGTPEHVGPILDGFIEFVERDLALWISQQGGWESFLYKYRAGFRFGQVGSRIFIVALPVILWIIISMFK